MKINFFFQMNKRSLIYKRTVEIFLTTTGIVFDIINIKQSPKSRKLREINLSFSNGFK